MRCAVEGSAVRFGWRPCRAVALGVVIGGCSVVTPGVVRAETNTPASAASMPGSFADLVQRVKPAVVNIATTEKVDGRSEMAPDMPGMPFPPDSPMGEFFRRFFGPGATMGQSRRARCMRWAPASSSIQTAMW